MYTRCGGVAAYHVVCIDLCLWSVRVCVFLPNIKLRSNPICGPEGAKRWTNGRTEREKLIGELLKLSVVYMRELQDVVPRDAETCKCDTAYFMNYTLYSFLATKQ